MSRLAIIGANESIDPLIRKAKDLGYETHVFAWKTGAEGEKNADFFYPVSIDQKDEILKLCQDIQPEGVCSITSDFAVRTVNYVARGLGLKCNSEECDLLARNKYHMRRALREHGLPTPWFLRVDHSLSRKEAEELTYPLIVKPTDRWSSKGVCRVNAPKELAAAVNRAMEESLEKKAILEEFAEGPEYSCECISYAGKHRALAITKKYTTGYPHYIETGHMQTSDIPPALWDAVQTAVFRALDALKIQYGASHTEFKLRDNGEIFLIETGARMGGDCIGTDLVQISTGYDYIRMVIDAAVGKEPAAYRINAPKTAMVKYICSREDYEQLRAMLGKYPEYIWRISQIDPIGTRKVTDSSGRYGYCLFAIDRDDISAVNELTGLMKDMR